MSRERDRSPRDDRDADVSYDPAPKIFVGGLPFSMTPEDIRETFEELGPVVEFHLPRTQYDPRKHKGFAFITFDSFKTMDTVIHKMHGKEVGGQVITVNRATVNKSRVPGGGGGGGGSGGYGGREYGRYDDRSGGGSRYDGRTPYDTSRPPKPIRIGFRCRVTGLAPDVDWRLLKDFLRQIGDVTYANVDEQGRGIGEYMTLDEVREAIDKLTGAAINGSVVKVTPLNFDMQTGQKFDLAEERPNSRYDVSRGGGHTSSDRYNSSHSDRYNSSSHSDRYYDSSSRGGGDRDRDTRGGGYGGSSGRYYGSGAEGGSSRGAGGGGDTRGGYDSSYRGYDNSRGGDDRSGRSGGYYQHDSRGGGGGDRGGYGDRSGGYDTGRGGGSGSYRSGSTRERERSPVGRSGGYGSGGSYRDTGTAGTYGSGRTYDKGGGGGGGYDRTGGYDAGGRYTGGSSGAAAGGYGGSPVTATPATAGTGRYGRSSAAAAGTSGGGGGGGAAAADGAAAGSGSGGAQGYDENGAGGGEAAGSYGRTWRVT